MEKKTIEKGGNVYEVLNKKITVYKPKANENGEVMYKDALLYLARVLPQDIPCYNFLFTLASFSMQNSLSEKQRIKADEFILFYKKEGVL